MHNNSALLFTNVHPCSLIGKIIQFPLLRILIVVLFLLPVTALSYVIGPELAESIGMPYFPAVRYGRDLIFLILFMIAYGLYTKYVERREARELSFGKFYLELGVGALMSFFLVCLMVLLLYILGYYKIVAFNQVNNLTDALVNQMMVGFSEELIFRLILFKLVEEFAGSWIAIAVQGAFFGLAHLGNPNATFGTSVGLVVSTTFLFGGAYMLTRRIWLILGLHWSWNFFQSGVFGMANSGTTKPGWITSEISGPAWITGGAFGIEASVVAIILLFIVGVYVFWMAVKNGQLVRPVWVRRRMEALTEQVNLNPNS